MSELDVDAIRARAEAATSGPWTVGEQKFDRGNRWRLPVLYRWASDEDEGPHTDQLCVVEYPESGFQYPHAEGLADAEFIARARKDIPALIAEVERLRKANARLDRDLTEEVNLRELREETADNLAHAIAAMTGADIGEHSSTNDPWRNALDAAKSGEPA